MIESAHPSQNRLLAQGRDKLLKAFEMEFDLMMNRPIIQCKEFRGWYMNNTANSFLKNGSVGNAVVWGATRHPLALFISAVTAAAVAAKNLSEYENYGTDQQKFGMAVMILLNVKSDQFKSFSLIVAGGLLRFSKEVFVDRFSARYSALKEVSIAEPENKEAHSKLRIYEEGLREAAILEEEFLAIVTSLEEARNQKINKLKEEATEQKQGAEKMKKTLDTKYQAGLISHAEYSDQKAKLRDDKFESFAKKVGAFGMEKFVNLDDDRRNLEFFCRELVPEYFEEPEKAERSVGTVIFVLVAIIVIGIIVVARH